MISRMSRVLRTALGTGIGVVCVLTSHAALAAGSNMPWEQPLQQILDSVQGPVAKIVACIAIILTGLTWAFGETSGGFRRYSPDDLARVVYLQKPFRPAELMRAVVAAQTVIEAARAVAEEIDVEGAALRRLSVM